MNIKKKEAEQFWNKGFLKFVDPRQYVTQLLVLATIAIIGAIIAFVEPLRDEIVQVAGLHLPVWFVALIVLVASAVTWQASKSRGAPRRSSVWIDEIEHEGVIWPLTSYLNSRSTMSKPLLALMTGRSWGGS